MAKNITCSYLYTPNFYVGPPLSPFLCARNLWMISKNDIQMHLIKCTFKVSILKQVPSAPHQSWNMIRQIKYWFTWKYFGFRTVNSPTMHSPIIRQVCVCLENIANAVNAHFQKHEWPQNKAPLISGFIFHSLSFGLAIINSKEASISLFFFS